MKPLVVLDSCTILNLLRIDDEDSDFLLKLITKWRICLPETVFHEIKRHVSSKFYSKEKNDHIYFVINREFDSRKTMDGDIKKDLDSDFEIIIKFSGHNKRENGELYCVALALLKSRVEEDTVSLYTDDYKATEEFRDFFQYNRIGELGDTLDLLTLLYWSTPDLIFQYRLYRSYLVNLRAEYNQRLNTLVETIDTYLENKKKSNCKDRGLMENLSMIVDGYRRSDMTKIAAGLRFFQEGNRYKDVKQIVGDFDLRSVNRQLIRISEHINRLNQYKVFKIA